MGGVSQIEAVMLKGGGVRALSQRGRQLPTRRETGIHPQLRLTTALGGPFDCTQSPTPKKPHKAHRTGTKNTRGRKPPALCPDKVGNVSQCTTEQGTKRRPPCLQVWSPIPLASGPTLWPWPLVLMFWAFCAWPAEILNMQT